MNNVTRIAIVDPNDTSRSIMKSMLLEIDTLWLEAECARYEFFIDVASQTKPDVALISLDSDSEKGLELVSNLTHSVPETAVLVVSSSQEGHLILQAMRNGAKEFLSAPLVIEDFLTALSRVKKANASGESGGGPRSSQIISVAGVSGGVGCTSIAVNLACALARNEQNSVALVDLDLALGDADVWLDIIPDYTIQDVAENITRLDYSLLKRSLTKHSSGVFLLPRPSQMEEAAIMNPEELKRVLGLLKVTFSHVVIDVSKTYSDLDQMALSQSDSTLLCTQLDLPSLRNIVRLLQFFDLHEELANSIEVVVNRVGLPDSQISLNKALDTISRDIKWQIPNDYATMIEARNNGVPLVEQSPRAKLTKVFLQMANQFDESGSDLNPQDDNKKAKKLFGFLKT